MSYEWGTDVTAFQGRAFETHTLNKQINETTILLCWNCIYIHNKYSIYKHFNFLHIDIKITNRFLTKVED